MLHARMQQQPAADVAYAERHLHSVLSSASASIPAARERVILPLPFAVFQSAATLFVAIVFAGIHQQRQSGAHKRVRIWPIVADSLRGSALSALLLGLLLGLFTRPESVFDSFYDPLFKGLLSVLMLIMGIEAYARLAELRRVAHWFALYAFVATSLAKSFESSLSFETLATQSTAMLVTSTW